MDEEEEIQLLIEELSGEPKLDRSILLESLAEYIKERDGRDIDDIPDTDLQKKYKLEIEMGIVMKVVRLLELLRG